jgi:hypothetical protein
VTVNGSGDVDANGLRVDDANILSNGSGDVLLHVKNAAHVTLHGSGDVVLSGEPQVDVQDNGSGDVILD